MEKGQRRSEKKPSEPSLGWIALNEMFSKIVKKKWNRNWESTPSVEHHGYLSISVEKYEYARWRWWSILVLSLSFSPYYFLFFLYVAINPRRFRDGADLAISILSLSFSGYIFLSFLERERREIRKRRSNVSLFKTTMRLDLCNAKKYRYCRISVVVIFISYYLFYASVLTMTISAEFKTDESLASTASKGSVR